MRKRTASALLRGERLQDYFMAHEAAIRFKIKGITMKNTTRPMALVLTCIASTVASCALAQDWPQWRGPNRDGKVSGFNAPKTWPKELTQKWEVTVGEGAATPALVGDKLYVFARQEGNEIASCLDAATGKELWQEKYESLGADGAANAHSGPLSLPTVAYGKVVTLGVRGMLSCLDAATGKKLWRKDDSKAWPDFYTSYSPLIVQGMCIAHLGGRGTGAITAYDLASGAEKWKWTGSPTYASPVLLTVGGKKLVVAQTETKMVAIGASDGKLAWEASGTSRRRGRGRMGITKQPPPSWDGQTIISAGPRHEGRENRKRRVGWICCKGIGSNAETSVQFNTPVLKNGFLFGLTQGNELFCINAQNGQTAWAAPIVQAAGGGPPGGGGRGGRGGGFGSIVDAGSVLLALTPSSELIVFQPSEKAYTSWPGSKLRAHPLMLTQWPRATVYSSKTRTPTLWTID
jgi:outer membrane protein assembly factor BamB